MFIYYFVVVVDLVKRGVATIVRNIRRYTEVHRKYIRRYRNDRYYYNHCQSCLNFWLQRTSLFKADFCTYRAETLALKKLCTGVSH